MENDATLRKMQNKFWFTDLLEDVSWEFWKNKSANVALMRQTNKFVLIDGMECVGLELNLTVKKGTDNILAQSKARAETRNK